MMKLRIAILGATLVWIAAVWAQTAPPQVSPTAPSRSAASARTLAPITRAPLPPRIGGNLRTSSQARRGPQTPFEQRLEEMQETLTQMHAMLKQMQANPGSSKDQAAAANIRMWELMLGHLDRTLMEARQTVMQRAAMYQNPAPAGEASHDVSPSAPVK